MMPNLSDLIPLEEVPRRLPTRTHRSTVFRWAQKGRLGVKLKVVRVGSTQCTTEVWLVEFFEKVELARRKERAIQPGAGSRELPTPSVEAVRTKETLRRHGLMDP